MTPTLRAVGATETADWGRQARQGPYEFTFIAAWKDPRAYDSASVGKEVHVPMDHLVTLHVPRQARANTS